MQYAREMSMNFIIGTMSVGYCMTNKLRRMWSCNSIMSRRMACIISKDFHVDARIEFSHGRIIAHIGVE